MLYLSENLKKHRILKGLTQEELAELLHVTPQSVSKWERAECCPDISLLPALANIFGTSTDLLLGMDIIRADQTLHSIHAKATELQCRGCYEEAESVYREALLLYPNDSGMALALAGVLALIGKSSEAVELMEKGLPLCVSEKQRATTRAALCFLYLKCGRADKANALAAELPHMRECREIIQPLIAQSPDEKGIDRNIRAILLGDDK